jgi:hypothetical protein
MRSEQEQFAKVVLLGQRIYLNSQAMLTQLSRGISVGDTVRGEDTNAKLNRSLKDLESCLEEFERITEIDLSAARGTLEHSFQALERKDTAALYESVQKLYRDDYLSKIIELSK